MEAITTRVNKISSLSGQLGWSQAQEDNTGSTPLNVLAMQQELARTQRELRELLDGVPVVIPRGLLRDVLAQAGAFCAGRERYLTSTAARKDMDAGALLEAQLVAQQEERRLAEAQAFLAGPGGAVEAVRVDREVARA